MPYVIVYLFDHERPGAVIVPDEDLDATLRHIADRRGVVVDYAHIDHDDPSSDDRAMTNNS